MTSDHILTHATVHELGLAVFDNLHALFRAMAGGLGGDLVESQTLSRHLTFPTNPMFKGVWAARLSDGDADEALRPPSPGSRSGMPPIFSGGRVPGQSPTTSPGGFKRTV